MNQEAHFQSPHFNLPRLAEGVYAAIATDGGAAICNAGVIDLGGQVIVYDAFMTPQAARDLRQFVIAEYGRPPHLVINSHGHNDHTWGNQAFLPDTPIIATEATRQVMLTEGPAELEEYRAIASERVNNLQSQLGQAMDEAQRQVLRLWLGYFKGLVEAFPTLELCPPGITFTGQLQFYGKRRTARLASYANAHTASDAALFLPDDGIVFMSDLLFTGFHPYLGDGDPGKLTQALQEISQWEAECFVPGHGQPGNRDDLLLMIDYLQDCQAIAQELARENATPEEITQTPIPAKYAAWRVGNYFHTNLKFIVKHLSAR